MAGWFKRFRGEGGLSFGPKFNRPNGLRVLRFDRGFAAESPGIAATGGDEYKSRLPAVMSAWGIIFDMHHRTPPRRFAALSP